MVRSSTHSFFMNIAKVCATRSTCLRRHVGAVAVKDNHIIATGYNGAPSGIIHCENKGCIREQLKVKSGEKHELCRAVHAEQNLIAQAAYHGNSLNCSTVYCTHSPCFICAKIMINAGVSIIIYQEGYPDSMAIDLINESNVEIAIFHETTGKIQFFKKSAKSEM